MSLCEHWNLSGKVAIVTGADRGIGRAIGLVLGNEGVSLASVCFLAHLAQNGYLYLETLYEFVGKDWPFS